MNTQNWTKYENIQTDVLFVAISIKAIELDSVKATQEDRETTGMAKIIPADENMQSFDLPEILVQEIQAKVEGYLVTEFRDENNDHPYPLNFFVKEEFDALFQEYVVPDATEVKSEEGLDIEKANEKISKAISEAPSQSEQINLNIAIIPEDLNIGFIAKMCHEVNKAYCEHLGDTSQPSFEEAPDWQVQSAINGVQFHMDNPDAGPSGSHDNWMKEKLSEGWKLGEVKDPIKREHPCMVDYNDLSDEQRAKDVIFVSIVKTFVSNLKK